MSSSTNPQFSLIKALVTSLCHRLRTPLSVISNDLSYFEKKLPANECERSFRNLAQIKECLSSCAAPFNFMEEEKGTFQDLITFLKFSGYQFVEQASLNDRDFDNFPILKSVITTLIKLSAEIQDLAYIKPSLVQISFINSNLLQISLNTQLKPSLIPKENILSSSLSDVFNNFLNIDSPLPAIVDILILQSCAETKIEILENIFSITIKFPLRNS